MKGDQKKRKRRGVGPNIEVLASPKTETIIFIVTPYQPSWNLVYLPGLW